MRLTDASVTIRPRNTWEAVDLGVLMAQRHAWLLISTWLMVTLPIFGILTFLLWDHPQWALILFWWLKPAYDRLPLYILSTALFNETPEARSAIRTWFRLLKPQLIASLTWRRFSPSRSFTLPVQQLEGLSGAARRKRIDTLAGNDSNTAVMLTILGMHVEMLLLFGLIALFYMLVPQQASVGWDWNLMLQISTSDWWQHVSNLSYVLVLAVWEPVYVASGFMLYLNRRTVLEAWDIELTFRRLRQRLTGSTAVILLAAGLLLGSFSETTHATDSSAATAEIPTVQMVDLSPEAARQHITQLLEEPPFKNQQTITRWRLKEDKTAKKEDAEKSSDRHILFRFLEQLVKWFNHFNIPLILELLLWTGVGLLIFYIILRYRDWLSVLTGKIKASALRKKPTPPRQLFGLEIAPESLPDDIVSTAERLWKSSPRKALGLLYRALLSQLLHEYRLPLKTAHTEGEVLHLVEHLEQPRLVCFSRQLTQHWQALAYGHRIPSESICLELCHDWRELFDQGASQ